MILRWLPEDITVHNEDLEGKLFFSLGKSPNYSPQVWHMSRLPSKLTFGSIYSLQLFQLV